MARKEKSIHEDISITKTKLKIAIAIFIIVGSFLLISELMSSFYNNKLDTLDYSIIQRIAFSFKPTVIGIYIVASFIIIIIAFRLLAPLFNYVRYGKDYEKARRALINIPWWMIMAQILFWILGTTAYFILKEWEAESGIPYGWVLAMKNSTGLMAAIYTALYIHYLTGDIKKKLNIVSIEENENDFFISHIHVFNVISIIIYLVINLGYISYYNYNTPHEAYTEFIFNLRYVIAGVIFGTMCIGLVFITNRVIHYQTDFLENKLKEFSSNDQADLSDRIYIINYDKIGRLSHLLNRFMERLNEDMLALKSLVQYLKQDSEKIAGASHDISKITDEQAKDTDDISRLMKQYTQDMQKVSEHMVDQTHIVKTNNEESEKIFEGLKSIINFSGEVKDTTSHNLEIVNANVEKVEKSVESTLQVNDKIKNITKKIEEANGYTSNIDEILRSIEDIADQTNMLSMNASIEAAHAGAAGTGFAIVAQEIRGLANISSESVRKISSIMEKIKNSVSQSVQLAEQTLHEATSGSQLAREAGISIKTIGERMNNSLKMVGEVNQIASDQDSLVHSFTEKMQKLLHISEEIHSSINHQADNARDIETSLNSISGSLEESSGLSNQLKQMSDEMNNMNLRLEELARRFVTEGSTNNETQIQLRED